MKKDVNMPASPASKVPALKIETNLRNDTINYQGSIMDSDIDSPLSCGPRLSQQLKEPYLSQDLNSEKKTFGIKL